VLFHVENYVLVTIRCNSHFRKEILIWIEISLDRSILSIGWSKENIFGVIIEERSMSKNYSC
jgi:hypothetical protein